MGTLDDLKGRIEEQKRSQQKAQEKKPAATEEPIPKDKIDIEQVEKIVDRMKRKYKQEGVEVEEVHGKLGELRGIVAEGEAAKVNVQSVEELQEFRSPMVRNLGKFYLTFRKIFEPVVGFMNKLPIASDIRYYLFSANMHYSLKQWLALSVCASAIAGAFSFLILAVVSIALEIIIVFPIIISGIIAMFVLLIMLLIPRSKAQARGNELSVELPFTLRQMSTELKAGIGLYKAIQTISTSDYGVLSEEFGRTITEIEEGTDTKDALRHFALRSQSKALRNALFHLIRALKTGGNLSDVMNDIAEDVSFELRLRISDFAEKMNFFGVVYIFIAIVTPVFIGILGTVTNAPVTAFGSITFPPLMIAAVYLVAFPAILALMVFYLKSIEPRV